MGLSQSSQDNPWPFLGHLWEHYALVAPHSPPSRESLLLRKLPKYPRLGRAAVWVQRHMSDLECTESILTFSLPGLLTFRTEG